MNSRSFNRRDFLKLTGLGCAVVVSGCATSGKTGERCRRRILFRAAIRHPLGLRGSGDQP
jgi:hypothetical protein